MINRILAYIVCATIVLTGTSSVSKAFASRETPLVRAVQRAKDSVVNIHSEKTSRNNEGLFTSSRGRKVNGMGTGIVVDERGYIVTNFHVVNGVDLLRVTLEDGGTYDASVIRSDSVQDLALIKITPTKPLTVMPMGTSSDLMLGESVFAVGNAFGYEHTVTSGIISALSRDVEVNDTQSYYNLIQTDASINPGNSGGPLLNIDGEVVGINVAIRAGAQRIGFAIPIDDARRVIARLLSIEDLNHTVHGLLTKDVKAAKDRKLVVELPMPASPAEKAGFQAGDVIVKADKIDVVDGVDFERALLGFSAGETVDVQILREEKEETLSLELAAQSDDGLHNHIVQKPSANEPLEAARQPAQQEIWDALGIRIKQVNSKSRNLNGSGYRGGMQVVQVRSGSPADLEGIRTNDILVGIHIWTTVSLENVKYVIEHPEFPYFGSPDPKKFYILRGRETLFGTLRRGVLIGKKVGNRFPNCNSLIERPGLSR